jgi:hypothetical protein
MLVTIVLSNPVPAVSPLTKRFVTVPPPITRPELSILTLIVASRGLSINVLRLFTDVKVLVPIPNVLVVLFQNKLPSLV